MAQAVHNVQVVVKPFQRFKTFDGLAVMDVESEEPNIGVEQVERSRSANPGRWFLDGACEIKLN